MCSICFEECPTFELKCGHLFHKSCIKEWYKTNKTCPLCRKNILFKGMMSFTYKLKEELDDTKKQNEYALVFDLILQFYFENTFFSKLDFFDNIKHIDKKMNRSKKYIEFYNFVYGIVIFRNRENKTFKYCH